MKVGIYAGSFNPFHAGHLDVLIKAAKLFDRIIIASPWGKVNDFTLFRSSSKSLIKKVRFCEFSGTLVAFSKKVKATALIRGLRNSTDLEYERSMLYWNEDLGLQIPTIYIICDRNLVHISSSAIREVKKLK